MDSGITSLDSSFGWGMFVALTVVSLAIAYWPRVVALLSHRGRGEVTLPAGVTPLVVGRLSGAGTMDLLACGFMWIGARTPQQQAARSGEPVVESSAEAYLRGSFSTSESKVTDPREAALRVLADNDPDVYDVRSAMVDLWAHSGDDARKLGLLRNGPFIRAFLLGLAGIDLLVALVLANGNAIPMLLGGVVALFAGFHVAPRSFAGASLAGGLRGLRAGLLNAARETGSIDSPAARALVPAAATAAEIEVWAVAVGCKSEGLERTASHLLSLAHAASGRPKTIRYTEATLLSSKRLADSISASFRAVWHRVRPPRRGPGGAAPVLW